MKRGHAGQNFKLVSSHLLIFVLKWGQPSIQKLGSKKLASEKQAFPPPFLSLLDDELAVDYPDDPHLVSLFSMANLQPVCT